MPVSKKKCNGVIILRDSTPDEEEDVGKVKSPAAEHEADPPEVFEWAPPGHAEYIAPLPIPEEAEKDDEDAVMDDGGDVNAAGDAKME